MTYLKRVADQVLKSALSYSGGVLIEGVRACGKTATGQQHCSSKVALDVGTLAIRTALELQPQVLLEGKTPRLIDEWQLAPQLWNLVRHEIDNRNAKGQFILTGSSVPAEDAMRHPGSMRISRIRMRPMTLLERGLGSRAVSLKKIIDGEKVDTRIESAMDVTQTLEHLVHGGWPNDVTATTAQAQKHLQDYISELVDTDINRLDGEPKRDPLRMQALLRSLARHIGTEVRQTTIQSDISASIPTTTSTVAEYLNTLRRLFILEEQPAWAPHLRSKYAVRTSPKLHFVDPALAAATIGIGTKRLLNDLETSGQWFESWVVQHLRVMAEAIDGKIYHYRDKSGKEVDAIVELHDGSWAAFEVKLGQRQISAAKQSLLAFAKDIDTTKTPSPSVLAVISADGPIMDLGDGVITFPLEALTP